MATIVDCIDSSRPRKKLDITPFARTGQAMNITDDFAQQASLESLIAAWVLSMNKMDSVGQPGLEGCNASLWQRLLHIPRPCAEATCVS